MKYARVSIHEDVIELYANMTDEDIEDIKTGWGHYGLSPFQVLDWSFANSEECYTIVDGNDVLGMFGIMDTSEVWFMGTFDIDRVAIRIVRQGHDYFNKWLEKHCHITGYINSRYKKFVKWLKWEGFEVTDLERGYVKVEKWASR